MSHQGKPSTSTTSDAAQFVSRGGKGGRGRGGGGGRGQSSNKQQQQKTRQNTPGGGSGAQQGNKTTRPVTGAAPAGTPAAAQNGAGERKDGPAAPKQTQSYVPKAAPATAVPPSPSSSSAAAPPAGAQQLPVPTAATSAHQPTPQQSAAPAADGNGTTGAAALPAPSPHAPQPPTTGGQGPAPPYVGYTNGAGAPPPGGRGRGIPPRTQSAPPNLKEQKQSPIFIPTRATPNAGAFPAAPYYPPSGPYYPPPPGVQPGVSPTHPYAPPGQGVPPPRGGPNLYQPPGHGRAQGPPGAGAHGVGPQGGPPPAMGGPLPQNVGGPQMPPQQPMGPNTYVPPHRIPTFVPGRAAPFIPRGHAGLQPMPPPHSMPMQIPQKRTSRIPIIDPKTGKEVGNSPPKDESPLNDNASPYQQSPPGAGLRIPHGGGIMSHPYAPAGTSPSRQAPHFKPDDFADGGPVEQFAPNHPYAPGRSAAIPIEKPPSAAVTISKPPAPAETATTPAPATTTATTPTSVEQPSASAPQEAAKEAAAAPATAEAAASAQEPTTKPAEADKKEVEVSPPEKQQQKPEEEASKQPEESKAETPAPQAAEAKPEPAVEERKPEEPAPEVKPEEAVPEAAKQPEEAKQAPAADAAKDESSEKASEAQPAEPASAPEPTPATEKPTDEAEPGKAEQKPAAEESGKKAIDSRAGKAKPTRKGSVKKSDEGDARPSEAAEKKASEDGDKKPTEEPQKPKEEEQPSAKPAEAEQDDDDWEVKAEKEDLVLQKDISLRPSYSGSSGTQAPFRSTLTPQAGDASWSGSGSKRTYDRDFLLKFQTFCRERPDGLPPVEVILGSDDRAKGGAGGGGRGGKGGRGGGGMNSSGEWSRGQQQFANRGRGGPGMFAAAPGKFNAPPGLSAPMARGPGAARGAPQGGPMRRVPKKGMPGREAPPGIMPPPEPVAPMVDNPTVWKPSRRRGDDNEEIYGKVRSILNKLTSDKFGPLSGQMVELLKSKATTVEILREIINIIFDKALAEPGFSTMYAELCRVLEKNCPTFETNKEGKPQTFKRILLNRCQEAFEHKPNEEQPTDDPLKKEEMEIKQKRRMIGNIVFIGELYKEHMLTDKIMHECVFRRLLGEMKNPAEADLEALCKLMNTIGKVLDVPKAKNYMEAYFKRMKTLSQNPNIPSRIRFLLLDVLDLRANKWVSSVTEKPKQGGRGGAQPKSAGSAGPASAGGPGGRGGGGSGAYRPGGAGGGPQGGRASQDGWETVGRGGHSRGDRSERGGDRGGSTGSERGPPVTLSSGEVVLGPNQSRMGTMMGGTGAKGWRDANNKGRPQDSRRDAASSSRPGAAPAAAPKGNIFAALSDMPERSPQAESRQSARPTSGRDRSRSREDREGPAPSPRGDRGDARKEAAAPSPRSAEKETAEVAVGPLDPETEKSIKLLLEEFLDTQDEEEARQCVDDIEGAGFQPHLVKAIIVMATEKKEEVREMLLQLITHFHKKATITPAHFTAGLRLVLEQLDDIRLDAPMAPKVVGQFIGSALLDEYLNASFVLPALEPLVESGSALSVLVGLFNFYVENTSIGDTREFAKEAGWDVISMFKKSKRDPASVTEWIQVNGLDRVFPVAWAQGRLKALLESGDDAGKILTWMEENVARDVWEDEEFVQRLTGVFVEFVGARTKALSDAQVVAEEETKLFEQYAPLLKRFTADSPQTQQACLAAVQRFCFDLNFPDGLLERLFQNLLDNELVDDEAFSTWAADTQDSFGKSQALAQVSGWLSGAQKDDGEGAP